MMKILVCNDDGINAEGIKILASWARKLGEVTVSAPKVQQSAKSHAINIHEGPIEVKKVPYIDGVTAYEVNSTPVDSVRFGTLGLNAQYDLILSGVNRGFNMGEDILYSGTAANIFEASLRGAKGIAFSTDPTSFAEAEKWLDKIWDYFVKNDLLSHNDIYNVNIPLDAKGIKWTKQGGAYFTDEFIEVGEGKYSQEGYSVYKHGTNFTLDTDAVMNGYVSVTPLSTRRDNLTVFETLAKKLVK